MATSSKTKDFIDHHDIAIKSISQAIALTHMMSLAITGEDVPSDILVQNASWAVTDILENAKDALSQMNEKGASND